MKCLGAIVAVVLVAVPFVGAAGNEDRSVFDNENFLQSIRDYERLTGDSVDLDQVQVLATQEFQMPLGSIGIRADANYLTNELTVTPISAMPDTSAESGCVVVSQFLGYGYFQSPVGIGDAISGCPFGASHPGGPTTHTMVCTNSQYCYSEGFGNNGFVEIFCQFNTVTVAQVDWTTGAGSSLGNGVCTTFAFFFVPLAQWPNYQGFVYQFPNGPSAGLINW